MSDEELKKVANEVRKGIVTGVHAAKSGHPGGSLGAADIMTYLYFEEMNVDPADPRNAGSNGNTGTDNRSGRSKCNTDSRSGES